MTELPLEPFCGQGDE